MIGTFILTLLLQSFAMPPRNFVENPAVVSPVPKKQQKDVDKLWQRFLKGKEDPKVLKDADKLLKKNRDLIAVIVMEAYIDLYASRTAEAEARFREVLSMVPTNRIALSYLADFAFRRNDYAQASDLYSRLLEVDPSRNDVETKREKALLLATENLIRNAAIAEQENRAADAEALYRQATTIVPRDPSLHDRLGLILARQKKWEAALDEFQKARQFGANGDDEDRHIAEALTNLGRADEAREILDRLRKSGNRDANLETKLNELQDIGRWGRDIQRFREIAASSVLTREQMAALLVRYFPQITDFRRTPQIVTDIQNSWAASEIQLVVGVGLMDSRPNHTFEPSKAITRGELARALARLNRLVIAAAPSPPPITTSDVSPDSALYKDVQLVLNNGLLELDDSGSFNIGASVSGETGVRAVEKLLELSHGGF